MYPYEHRAHLEFLFVFSFVYVSYTWFLVHIGAYVCIYIYMYMERCIIGALLGVQVRRSLLPFCGKMSQSQRAGFLNG